MEQLKEYLIFFGFVGICGFGLYSCVKHDNDSRYNECAAKHPVRPWTDETLFAQTGNCTIKQVTKYNEECLNVGYVYVTDCAGVTWDQREGKTTRRYSNTRRQ